MKTKTCSKCKIIKSIIEFAKNRNHKDGLSSSCKDCIKIYRKIYYLDNKEEIAIKGRIYKEAHKQERREYSKIYYESHKQESKDYRETHKKEILRRMRKYHKFHKIERNNLRKKRLKTDSNYKILVTLRDRLHHAIKRNSKAASTKKLLGCSIEFLKNHLQNQFTKGMTWKNHGFYGWHIGHIKPCSLFDLSKPSEQRKCFNYTNLQPLWATENYKKGANYE